MPVITASAPGKIILLGEHAVVYDRPAIAIPVHQVQVKVSVSADIHAPGGRVRLESREIGLTTELASLPADHPLALAVNGTLQAVGVTTPPAMTVRIRSSVPVAAGLGSGAAVSVALIRALSAFLGHLLDNEQVNALAYRVEQRLHGTPSGIDNTVITYARPIFFQRSTGFEPLAVRAPLTFLIADSGVKSPTREAVAAVRRDWEQDPRSSEALFDQIGAVVRQGRAALECGQPAELAALMNANHHALQELHVSSPELDHLVAQALQAGALGAKLSGGGRGGNMVALVDPARAEQIAAALRSAGAVRTIITHLRPDAAEAADND